MAVDIEFVPNGTQGAAATGTGVAKNGTAGTLLFDNSYPIYPPSDSELLLTGFMDQNVTFATSTLTNVGISFMCRFYSLPTAGNFYYFAVWAGNGTKVGDLRLDSTGAVSLRDFNTAKATSPAGLIVPGRDYRFFVRANPGSATGHQFKVWSGSAAAMGAGAADYDSGSLTCTGQAATTQVQSAAVGQAAGTQTYTLHVGRIRIDNAGADPGSGYSTNPSMTAVTATAGNNQVVLNWTAIATQTGCVVYRSTDGINFAALASQPAAGAATFTDTTAVNGTAYTYVVRCQNASGWTPKSAFVTATPVAATTQTAYLTSDITSSSVTAVGGTGPLYTAIDEPDTPDNTDYIVIPQGASYVGGFNTLATYPFPGGSVGTFSYSIPSGNTATVTATLMQGTTVIAADAPRTGAGTYSRTLTAGELALITSGANLRIKFDAS